MFQSLLTFLATCHRLRAAAEEDVPPLSNFLAASCIFCYILELSVTLLMLMILQNLILISISIKQAYTAARTESLFSLVEPKCKPIFSIKIDSKEV